MLPENIKIAINKCIKCHIPFVVFSKTGECDAVFFSNPSRQIGQQAICDTDIGFAVSLFNSNRNPYLISQECDTLHTLNLPDTKISKPSIIPWSQSTNQEEYIKCVNILIERLKHRGGKTVYSKVITGSANQIYWGDVIDGYFSSFQATFRYAYYLPETGFWMGASPEILLMSNKKSAKISTMSLAGTRPITDKSIPWDIKNKEEHDIVTKYIVNVLKSEGIDTHVSADENIAYGSIEHLCNRIVGTRTNNIGLYHIANKLSPTPALAGFPISEAINDISDLEAHPRYCYGGYVAINDPSRFYAYVNLRCVHFNNSNYCIYGGGGITARSNASDEWNETEAKTARLRELLNS